MSERGHGAGRRMRLRLLIVEDSDDDALLDALVLEDAGYDVDWQRVQDGAGLTAALERRRWDLVLCDHALPQFDSFGALRVLAGAGKAALPLVVVSGAIGEETAAAVIREGAADFVNKSNLTRLPTVAATVLRDARAHRAAARTEARFRSAFDDAACGSALVDLGGRPGKLLRVNDALCEAVRMTAAELKRVRLQKLVHEAERDELDAALRAAAGPSRSAFQTELRLLDAVGKPRWSLVSLAPVHDSGDERPCAIAQFIDINARKRTEEALQLAHQQALSASRMKSEFMANVSHEIRTPLNGVLGLTDLLADTELSDDQRDYVSGLRTSGQALMAVIEQVLDFSKIEAGKVELASEPFTPSALVQRALTIVAPAAADKSLSLSSAIEREVPLLVRGDPARILGVLTNLLGNAVKFTGAGGTVALELSADAARPALLRFSVRDTGIGIAPGMCEQIFQPFSQGDASTSRRFGGTGLGLTISKQLVELMGGTIGVRSAPGVGSTFAFQIPCEPIGEDEAASRIAEPDGSAAAGAPAIRSQAATAQVPGPPILLVEDDHINRLVAERVLSRAGYGVEIARDGHEAVALATTRHYRLILMDCQMPGLDGYGATRAIRECDDGAGRTPIVAMTAHTMPGDREKCLANGMDDYISKPLHRTELERVLARYGQRPEPEILIDLAVVADVLADGGVQEGLLDLFLDQSGARLEGLRSAVYAGEGQRIAELAHSLHGSCATFGATAMAAVARRLSDHARVADPDRSGPLQRELERLFDPTREALLDAARAIEGHDVVGVE
ncbi:MAG TPA: response regulator [Solirubrobacteraceae bacterium]|nr:response regulator [Solirubrobacteraceae bacterium]